MKIFITVVVVLIGVMTIGTIVNFYFTHPCLASHVETQYEVPPSVVVGGGKYGGGIALPTGNAHPVQVVICDKR